VQIVLDQRFRCWSAPPGLERPSNFASAVQWSYDLLDYTEKVFLEKVFVVRQRIRPSKRLLVCGFDDADDEYSVLDLLDGPLRILAHRRPAPGPTRFSMLETILQFRRGQLAPAASNTVRLDRILVA